VANGKYFIIILCKNNLVLISTIIYIWPADNANVKMDERNAQQRKRRAEMTDEEREANKRRQHEYQRQYRAWKKVELQNVSTTSVVMTQIMPESSLTGEKYLQLLHFLNCLIYILNRWAYVKVRVLELDFQLYWKMTIQNIPPIGYT
jgi:hypothetical protein